MSIKINSIVYSFFDFITRAIGISIEPKFEIVDNLDSFVKDKLNSMLEDAKNFDIATGYFQISAWRHFADSIQEILDHGGKVRLLIGNLESENISPSTAKFLLRLIENPQIEAKTIKPKLLHAKVFLAKTDSELRLLFGSSNLTYGGMESNIELNTYEVLDLNSKKAKKFIEWYDNLWESAIPIDEELKSEIVISAHRKQPGVIYSSHEDPVKALYLSLLIKDLTRVDLRDVGNFFPLKFQYVDAVAVVNRYFFQPGGKRGLILAHEVGLGKTIISGIILKYLIFNGYINNALIITPLSIVRQWKEDLKNKFNIELKEITSRNIKNLLLEDSKTYIISYDLLKQHINNFSKDWDFIIVDESHFVRNSRTQRFKALRSLKSKFHLLLTATPMHNSVEDIVSQLYLFVPEEIINKATKKEISKVDRTKLFKAFMKRRLQKNELKDFLPERKVFPPIQVELGYKEKELYEALRKFFSEDSKYYQVISRSIENIAPFIKIRYLEQFISSKLAAINALDNLKRRIESARDKGYIEINFGTYTKDSEGIITDEISTFIEDELESQSRILTSRDAQGNLIVKIELDEKIREALDFDIKFLNEILEGIENIEQFSKIKETTELIESLKPSESKKIVTFVSFVKTGEELSRILRSKGIRTDFFYGELGESQRDKLIRRLWNEEEDRIDVLISTDAAYVGLNLQTADTIIHHDLSWNPMVVEQRIGRIHRIGQKRPVTSYSFLCKDTVDERKYLILTNKLESISTHLGISYDVVLSEVASSSDIERYMAQLELREIDDNILEEKIKNHIAERKEIFDLLKDLPSEESEIIQIGFNNDLVNKVEDIVIELINVAKSWINLKVTTIPKEEDFILLEYNKNQKNIKELVIINDKRLIKLDLERFKELKNLYNFDNLEPNYLGPFHEIITKISELSIEKFEGKFWKKNSGDKTLISLYAMFPLIVKNISAKLGTSLDIFVPLVYDPEKDEITIDSSRVYELSLSPKKAEAVDENDLALLEKSKIAFLNNLKSIQGKIKSDIEKIKIEIEEIAIQRQRKELEKRLEEKKQKLLKMNDDINRKKTMGINFEKEINDYKKTLEELEDLSKRLRVDNITGLDLEFGEPRLVGGCIFYSEN